MVRDVLELRSNNWLPRREEVVNISDHILKIKQEVEAELFGEDTRRGHLDTNTTGDYRFEGHERVRYTRDQLLQLMGNILQLKQGVEAELFGEDADGGGCADATNVQGQSQSCYSELDIDNWCSVFAQLYAPIMDRSLDPLRENREIRDKFYSREQEANEYNVQEQLCSKFARTEMSPNQGVVNISDHILNINQEVEAELIGEDAARGHADSNTTGDSRFEGHECISYTRDQLLQLREVVNISGEMLNIKQEVESELFSEDANASMLFRPSKHASTPVSDPSKVHSFLSIQHTPESEQRSQGGPAPTLIKANRRRSAARRSKYSG